MIATVDSFLSVFIVVLDSPLSMEALANFFSIFLVCSRLLKSLLNRGYKLPTPVFHLPSETKQWRPQKNARKWKATKRPYATSALASRESKTRKLTLQPQLAPNVLSAHTAMAAFGHAPLGRSGLHTPRACKLAGTLPWLVAVEGPVPWLPLDMPLQDRKKEQLPLLKLS
jgi:hypothetical protein